MRDETLEAALAGLAREGHPALRAGARLVAEGDEAALRPDEEAPFPNAVPVVRRRSGAARLVARALIGELGGPSPSIRRDPTGAPIWPTGIVGSLAHDEEVAVAAVARAADLRSVGIDVEPSRPLPERLLGIVATPSERRALAGDLLAARALFAIKEAVYKATHPLDGRFLDFGDVEVDPASLTARTRTGHRVRVHLRLRPRILALVAIPP